MSPLPFGGRAVASELVRSSGSNPPLQLQGRETTRRVVEGLLAVRRGPSTMLCMMGRFGSPPNAIALLYAARDSALMHSALDITCTVHYPP